MYVYVRLCVYISSFAFENSASYIVEIRRCKTVKVHNEFELRGQNVLKVDRVSYVEDIL